MAIKLIQEDERLTFEFDGSKIFYKRIPRSLQDKWRRELLLEDGEKIDWDAVGMAGMKYAIIGWEGFLGPKDESFEFEPGRIDTFINSLPNAISNLFTAVLSSGLAPKEKRRKN